MRERIPLTTCRGGSILRLTKMKIKNMTIVNFKNAPNATYDLKQLNALVGPNGRGKTSVMNALRYLLSGNLPDDPIRHGEDHLHVSAVLDDGQDTTIERFLYLPDTYQINGKSVKEKVFAQEAEKYHRQCEANSCLPFIGKKTNPFFLKQDPEVLWSFMEKGKVEGARIYGVKELTLELADGTELYMRRSLPSKVMVDGKKVTAKAFSELIASRMGGDFKALDIVTSSEVMSAMSMADFSKYLIGIIPVTVDFDKLCELAKLTDDEVSVLRPLFPPAPAAITLSDVASAYKMLFAARTDIRRQMDEWEKRAMFSGELPIMDKGTVQERLENISQKLGSAGQLVKAWDIYKQRTAEREKALSTYKEWAKAFNAMENVNPVVQGSMEQLLKNEEDIRKQERADEQLVSRLEQSNKPLMAMLQNLNSTACPVCSTLTCSTDKSAVKADIERIINDNLKMIKEARERIQTSENRIKENRKMQDSIREQGQKYEKRLALYRNIQGLKETIPQVPAKPDPLPDVSSLQIQQKRYQGYLEQAAVFNACIEAEKKFRQMKMQHELYSRLVKKAEPKKGLLTNTILEYVLAPFCNHCNQFLQSVFGDIEITFQMEDDGLQVYCKPHNRSSFMSVNALSTGEKMLVSLALMDMVSAISNTRMLFFDCLEALDEEAIDALLSLLQRSDVQERYDHIIIALVGHESIMNVLKTKNVHKVDFNGKG